MTLQEKPPRCSKLRHIWEGAPVDAHEVHAHRGDYCRCRAHRLDRDFTWTNARWLATWAFPAEGWERFDKATSSENTG